MTALQQNELPYVFISYAHADSDLVIPIIEHLTRRGLRIWYDSGLEAGTEWLLNVAVKLQKSNAVIAFLTPNYPASDNCRREIISAIDKRISSLVVFLEPTELPPDLDLQFTLIHKLYRDRHPTDASFLDTLLNSELLQSCRDMQSEPDAEADYIQGCACERKEDYSAAIRWYTSAAEKHHIGAQLALGHLYENACDYINETEAVRWYRAAALQNDPRGQYELGECYRIGIGVPITPSLAADWLNKSALQGYRDALDSLYILAEENEPVAQYALGSYYYGRSGPLAFESVKWLTRAVDQGYTPAQYLLGRCFFFGEGTHVDRNQARQLLRMAAEQKHEEAIQFLARYHL